MGVRDLISGGGELVSLSGSAYTVTATSPRPLFGQVDIHPLRVGPKGEIEDFDHGLLFLALRALRGTSGDHDPATKRKSSVEQTRFPEARIAKASFFLMGRKQRQPLGHRSGGGGGLGRQ